MRALRLLPLISSVLAGAVLLLFSPAPAPAQSYDLLTAPDGESQPVGDSSQLRPGDELTARATFRPPEIESFDLEVLSLTGTEQDTGPRPHFFGFVARASGEVVERHRGLPDGVSGAPVYRDGRLVGAVRSIVREEFGSKDIVFVETIEENLRLLELPSMQSPGSGQEGDEAEQDVPLDTSPEPQPDEPVSLREPITLEGREFSSISESRGGGLGTLNFRKAVDLEVLGTELTEDDLPETWYRQWDSLAWSPMFSPDEGFPENPGTPTPLRPGAPVSLVVMRGGYPVSMSGMLTAVDADGRFLAFGHDLLGMLGTVDLPLAQEHIINNFTSLSGNWQLSQPGALAGTIREDRLQGVAGFLGDYTGDFVEMNVTSRERGTERSGSDTYQVASHPDLIVQNLPMLSLFALSKQIDNNSYGTLKMDWSLSLADREEPVEFSNIYHSSFAVQAGTRELNEALSRLYFNDREKFTVTGLDVDAEFSEKRNTARIADATLGTMEGGEFSEVEPELDGSYQLSRDADLAVRVSLMPYHGESETRTFELSGDALESEGELEPGQWVLQVRGGSGTIAYQHDVYPAYLEQLREEKRRFVDYYQPPAPETAADVLDRLFPDERNDELIVELVNPMERERNDEGYLPYRRVAVTPYEDPPTLLLGYLRFVINLQ